MLDARLFVPLVNKVCGPPVSHDRYTKLFESLCEKVGFLNKIFIEDVSIGYPE